MPAGGNKHRGAALKRAERRTNRANASVFRPPRPPKVVRRLDHEQRRIATKIVRKGERRHAKPVRIKAALETGRVESQFRNLKYGDADSRGWRQERASIYKNPNNVGASIDRFYREASKVKGSSGQIAAAVQKPLEKYRGRYAQVAPEAGALYHALKKPRKVRVRRRLP